MQFEKMRFGELDCLVSVPRGQANAVLVGMHGRGSLPERLSPTCELLGNQFTHVLPMGLLPHGDGFGWYVKGPEASGQIRTVMEHLIPLVAEVRTRFAVGPESIGAWGFSQGGVMALRLGLEVASPLAAIGAIGAKLDDPAMEDDALLARARGRDFLLVHGVNDEVIPHLQSRRAFGLLSANGGRVELAELPMAHEITPVAAGAVRGFFRALIRTAGASA